jgi:hypothetical protein
MLSFYLLHQSRTPWGARRAHTRGASRAVAVNSDTPWRLLHGVRRVNLSAIETQRLPGTTFAAAGESRAPARAPAPTAMYGGTTFSVAVRLPSRFPSVFPSVVRGGESQYGAGDHQATWGSDDSRNLFMLTATNLSRHGRDVTSTRA